MIQFVLHRTDETTTIIFVSSFNLNSLRFYSYLSHTIYSYIYFVHYLLHQIFLFAKSNIAKQFKHYTNRNIRYTRKLAYQHTLNDEYVYQNTIIIIKKGTEQSRAEQSKANGQNCSCVSIKLCAVFTSAISAIFAAIVQGRTPQGFHVDLCLKN